MLFRLGFLIMLAVPAVAPSVYAQEAQTEITTNRRPFVDLGKMVNDLLDKKQIDLDSPFTMSVSGKLVNGRIEPRSFKINSLESSNTKMRNVLSELIKAIDASGFLSYLTMAGIKDVNFKLGQDNENVTAVLESAFDNDLRPKTIATMLSTAINMKKEGEPTPTTNQDDQDELTLLRSTSVTPIGKSLVLSWSLSKADVQRMLQRKLASLKVPEVQ